MRSLYYPITLPDSFDMRAIEHRVRDRAPAFDGLEGLALKAFLVTSTAHGAPKNLCAPFYVWDHAAAMAEFLGGPLFHAVTESFGRPQAFDRPVLQFNIVCRDFRPQLATIEEIAVDTRRPLIDTYWAESAAHRRTLDRAGLYAAATVLDTTRWTVHRVGLWRSKTDASRAGANAQQLSVLAVVGNAVRPDRRVAFEV
jgi:hypothetical protein